MLLECYVLRLLALKKIILLGGVSLMICCYTLRENLCHWKLLFLRS